ncbi:MAG: PA2169 family four-helix-bundle protein [Phycisphaerales bacterium]|nr:PA2169 family four-helix-bundle protein [Phycisphaerales bacterium]
MTLKTSMPMSDDTVEQLQNLIRINIDSCKGFEQSAETIESESIAGLFRQIGRDRRHHAQQLRNIVSMTDTEAEDSGSIKGSIHRWWLSARGALNGGDDHVVLIEAERGEDAIKHCYEDAIKDVKEPAVRQVLTDQYAEVKRGHDTVRDLRDMVAAS